MTWRLNGTDATPEQLEAMRTALGVTDGVDGTDGQGFTWQGLWSDSTNYAPYDVVSWNGSSYMCIAGIVGDSPSNATYWSLFATKGDDGIVVADTAPVNTSVLWADTADAGTGFGPLPVVAITDAAISMVANTRYGGGTSGLTANRIYRLPAGSAGDRQVIGPLRSGNASFNLNIHAPTSGKINGGTDGALWSSLFIAGEYVSFVCEGENDWWVEVDGRIASFCELSLASDAVNHFINSAYTKIPVDTVVSNIGSIGSVATDSVTVRRAGRYLVTVKARDFGTVGIRAVRLSVNAVTELLYIVDTTSSGHSNTCFRELPSVSAGHVIFAELFHTNGGDLNAVGNATDKPNLLAVREIL